MTTKPFTLSSWLLTQKIAAAEAACDADVARVRAVRAAELEQHAREWEALAVEQDERAAYNASLGHVVNAELARARSYRDTAKSLRLEAETGEWHCSCHLMPASKSAEVHRPARSR